MSITTKFVEVTLKRRSQRLYTVDNASNAAAIAREVLEGSAAEQFLTLHLNQKHAVMAVEQVAKGSIHHCPIVPADVFRGAIINCAVAVILVHNHPSGDLTFSDEDLQTSKKLVMMGKLLGVTVLDHILVAGDQFHSLQSDNPEFFEDRT